MRKFNHGNELSARLAEQDGIHLVNPPTTAWPFDKGAPRGWVDAQLSGHGMRLVLHVLDAKHRLDCQTVELEWRRCDAALCEPHPRRLLRGLRRRCVVESRL
ncbi:MAG: hypothetical protein ACYC35_12280 [Pirellulales bacterium]